jgi:uncharacterized membrane protein YuzA (DUF378 family)
MWFIELVLSAFSGQSSFARKAIYTIIAISILIALFQLFMASTQKDEGLSAEKASRMLYQIQNPIK